MVPRAPVNTDGQDQYPDDPQPAHHLAPSTRDHQLCTNTEYAVKEPWGKIGVGAMANCWTFEPRCRIPEKRPGRACSRLKLRHLMK
jgi:hypothetical protein